jgi:hypothetical protein
MSSNAKASVALRRAIVASGVLAGMSSISAFGGVFTGPLTNAFLSVDINGGPLGSLTPTNGYNENTSAGTFSADPYGVVWSPWFGNSYAGGDGVAAPSGASGGPTSISKTYAINGPPVADNSYWSPIFLGQTSIPATTVTISEPGTLSNYAANGLSSRDRGTPSGPFGAGDNDMFQDFVFAGSSGSNTQGTNYLQLQFTGLTPGGSYEIAAYSYANSSGHSEAWTATAPYAPGGYTNSGGFLAPSDEQVITWATGGATQAPAVFTVTADGTGSASLWTWGGSGVTGDSNSTASYIDGFQIAAVPEPATLGLVGIASMGLLARRRRA